MTQVGEKLLASTAPAKNPPNKDIRKTFDIFSRESISNFKDKIIEIILVEADNIFAQNKRLFNVDLKKDKSMQISVINDRGTYDLLSNTWKRHKQKQENSASSSFRLER